MMMAALALPGCGPGTTAAEMPASPDREITSTPTLDPGQVPGEENPGTNSGLDPSPTPDLEGCLGQGGTVAAFQVTRNSVELSGSIYTPPCYGQDPGRHYPVLYLLHGATETDRQWLDLGIASAADSLISAAAISPLVIVMPRELTWISLQDNPFGDDLVTELLPWIESRYLVLEGREFRALGGLSRGGNWAVRIGLLHWGLFGSIGAHSTPLFYGDLEKLPGWIAAIPPARYPRIYLDVGQDDNNLEAARNFEQALAALDVPHRWIINPGLHNDAYWSAHLMDYLVWYSAAWEELLEN